MNAKAAALAICAALSIFTMPAASRVVRLEIASSTPYGTFATGDFVRIEGNLIGELSPDEAIPGLKRAAAGANGMVAYQAPFVVIAPARGARANGALLIDVPNRGRPISHFLYNSGREKFQPLALDPRSGFLQHQGFTVAMVQWELGQGITLPTFKDDTGAMRYVEGVGLAAIRDFADFLRQAGSADNPVAGRIDRALAVGYSQTARLLKTLLIEGFNHVGARQVFDGMHVHASASGIADVMATGRGPASSTFFTPRLTQPEHRGVTEEPLAYSDIVKRAVQKNGAVPKLLITNTTTDYFNIRASLSRTGAAGLADLPVPDNARIYDIAGASHGRSEEKKCHFEPGRLDFFPVMRATLVNLDRWVKVNKAPPRTRLMPLEPQPHEESLLQAPMHLPGAIVQVPRRDADGNSIGGVRLPEIEVPLGTHAVQNPPFADRGCNLDAGYIPFARSRAERAAGDARASVEERYSGNVDYVRRIEKAAARLVSEGFMLRDDVAPIVKAAQQAF